MRRVLRAWPWLLMIAAAALFAVAARTGPEPEDSPLPSVHNPGPRGAKVLVTWLEERGTPVRVLTSAEIPAGIQTLVVATAPGRRITDAEADALQQFAAGGGTLIYLAPRPVKEQPELAHRFHLSDGAVLAAAKDAFGDVNGAVITVTGQHRFLAGVGDLRFTTDTAVEVDDEAAEKLAGGALWRLPIGTGEVLIAAGADLVENRRLDLAGNAQFWANAAARPMAIHEFLLNAGPPARWSLNLWTTFAQFVFVALLFVAARAQRLGPPRPALRRQHRSSLEYVASMAGLLERAHVDAELAPALRLRLRRLMHERLGIPEALGARDASVALAARTGLAPEAFVEFDQKVSSSAPFAALAADAARLEDAIVGRLRA